MFGFKRDTDPDKDSAETEVDGNITVVSLWTSKSYFVLKSKWGPGPPEGHEALKSLELTLQCCLSQ